MSDLAGLCVIGAIIAMLCGSGSWGWFLLAAVLIS